MGNRQDLFNGNYKKNLDSDRKIVTVWFDAWRYEKEEYLAVIPNQAIGGQTPAEAAGISLNLGQNKIENLMRQAAIVNQKTNLEPFVFELGVRVNKLVISSKDDSIEIKTKEFLDKKTGEKLMKSC